MVWTLVCLATLWLAPPDDAPPLQRPGQRKPTPAPVAPAPAPKPAPTPAPAPKPGPAPTPKPKPAPEPAPEPPAPEPAAPEPDAPTVQRPGQTRSPWLPPAAAPRPKPTPAPAATGEPDPSAPIVQRPGQRPSTPLDDPDGLVVPLPGRELTPFDYPDGPHVLPPSLAARDYGYANQVWEDERAPTLQREQDTAPDLKRPDRTGFVWQLGVGYTSTFVITQTMIPSVKFDGFAGGSLARRQTHRGTRKSGMGMLAEVELPVGVHRYHFAFTGLAGRNNTFYWRFNTGLSFNRRTPLIGVGGNVGLGIDVGRQRITELVFAIAASVDGGAASTASLGITASVLRF